MATNPYAGLSDEAREKCIQRMARTLAKKPRSRKTRLYIKSLSGRPETEAELRQRAVCEPAIVEPEPICLIEEPRVRKARKQRISPFADKSQRRHPTKHCRRASRFQRHVSNSTPRQPRDMTETAALRKTLSNAQSGLCAICGELLGSDVSIDHVIPHSMLGGHGDGNFVAVHGVCNGDKSNDVPTGCEMVWLLAVNARLGLHPQVY